MEEEIRLENSFFATKNNTIEGGVKKKKDNKKYYNYLKKGYFAKNCLESPKINIYLGNLHVNNW